MGGAVTPRESAGAPVAGDTAAFSRRPAPRDGASAGASEDLWPHPAPRPQEKGHRGRPSGGGEHSGVGHWNSARAAFGGPGAVRSPVKGRPRSRTPGPLAVGRPRPSARPS